MLPFSKESSDFTKEMPSLFSKKVLRRRKGILLFFGKKGAKKRRGRPPDPLAGKLFALREPRPSGNRPERVQEGFGVSLSDCRKQSLMELLRIGIKGAVRLSRECKVRMDFLTGKQILFYYTAPSLKRRTRYESDIAEGR
jgi:hypothetical protein